MGGKRTYMDAPEVNSKVYSSDEHDVLGGELKMKKINSSG